MSALNSACWATIWARVHTLQHCGTDFSWRQPVNTQKFLLSFEEACRLRGQRRRLQSKPVRQTRKLQRRAQCCCSYPPPSLPAKEQEFMLPQAFLASFTRAQARATSARCVLVIKLQNQSVPLHLFQHSEKEVSQTRFIVMSSFRALRAACMFPRTVSRGCNTDVCSQKQEYLYRRFFQNHL